MAIAIPPIINETQHGVIGTTRLKPDVCKQIIQLSNSISPIEGKVQRKDTDQTGKITDIRSVLAYRIHEDYRWVDELLINMIVESNHTFNYNLSGLMERPQLLKYKAPSIGYGWHTDMGNGDASTRKLGVTIQLNNDFEGGEFMVFNDGEQEIPLDKGNGIVFSSFLPHKVNQITKGERWSLVAWVAGACFR